MKTEDNKYKNRAVYTGRRRGRGGKVLHRFELLPSGKEMAFKGVKGYWIGYVYCCSKDSIPTHAVRAGDAEPVENENWVAEDALVDRQNKIKRSDARMKRLAKQPLDKAIEALVPLVKGLDYFDRKPLVEYLVELASKKALKKG